MDWASLHQCSLRILKNGRKSIHILNSLISHESEYAERQYHGMLVVHLIIVDVVDIHCGSLKVVGDGDPGDTELDDLFFLHTGKHAVNIQIAGLHGCAR